MFRRVLYALAGAALALSIGGAGAYFTTQIQVPDSVISAGSVDVSAEPTSAPLSIPALAPGGEVERPLAVRNEGTLPVDIVVTSSKKAGITAFWETLTCRVTSGTTALYDGPLAALQTEPLRVPAGGSADLRFHVGLPASAGNDLAEDYVKVSLYIDAEQAH